MTFHVCIVVIALVVTTGILLLIERLAFGEWGVRNYRAVKEDWPMMCDVPGCDQPLDGYIHHPLPKPDRCCLQCHVMKICPCFSPRVLECDDCNCVFGSSYGCPVHDPENAPKDDDLMPWEEATWD